MVLDRVAEEDDPLPQQPRVDVVGALATAAGLDDHRDEHLGSPGCRRVAGGGSVSRPGRLVDGSAPSWRVVVVIVAGVPVAEIVAVGPRIEPGSVAPTAATLRA